MPAAAVIDHPRPTLDDIAIVAAWHPQMSDADTVVARGVAQTYGFDTVIDARTDWHRRQLI